MNYPVYLSPKSAGQSTLMFIKTNCHNQQGWIEAPNGKHSKLDMTKAMINEHSKARNRVVR